MTSSILSYNYWDEIIININRSFSPNIVPIRPCVWQTSHTRELTVFCKGIPGVSLLMYNAT